MIFLSKIRDLQKSLKSLFSKKKQADEPPILDENPSMTEGEKPVVHKIKKNVVYIIVGILVVAFFGGLYMGSGDDTKTVTPKEDVKPANTSDRNPKLAANYDNRPGGQTQQQQVNPNTGRVTQANQVIRPESGGYTNVPAMATAQGNYSSPVYQPNYSAYTPNASLPQQSPQADGGSLKETVKENFQAAIRFALGGGGGTNKDNNVSGDASTAVTNVSTATSVSPAMAYTSGSDNILQAGSIIPAILATGINTDIGGQVVAQVQSDVYDSLTGNNLLIPSGSRLIGTYNGGAGNGQSRVNITWATLLLPNGGSYSLGNSMVAIDGAGYAGIEGNVNNHTSRQLSAGAISSALGALASIATGNTTTSTGTSYNAGQLAAQGAATNLMNTASSLFQKNMNIQPTITVEPGYSFNVFVTTAIAFNPY